jgi:hypothetical protein
MRQAKDKCFARISSLDSLIIIFQPHNVILTQIVTELHFNDCQRLITAVAQPVIGLRWDVDVLAPMQLQLQFATDDIRNACNHDPVLSAPCVALQAKAGAWFHLEHFDFEPGPLFQDFVPAPWSLVKFPHRAFLPAA